MSGSPNPDNVRDERTTRDDAEPPVRNTQQISDMVELLPCPRCGGPAWVLLTDVYEIWCRTDRCLRLPARATEAEARSAWNTRVGEASHHADMVERVARAIDGELPVLETSETLKAAAVAALQASCHADLRNMVERLLGRMGIDSCGYDAKLYAQVEDLLAKIGSGPSIDQQGGSSGE